MSRNQKFVYVWSILIGASVGPLILIVFSGIFLSPKFFGIANFIGFLSQPVLYLLANILDTNSIPLAISLLIPYWAFLGIGITCGLAWLILLISSTCGKIIKPSMKNKGADMQH